ncbi:MAG: hypothetical protein PHE02_14865 [Lachnospiraceae bacterium]|nr:hypothetical protein [Lachnospiraceae bacterium]
MIDAKTFIVLNIVKKEDFSGSLKGMRYRLHKKKQEESEDAVIEVCIWPQPYSYDKTAEEEKEYKDFSFDESGRLEIVDWLNRQYELQKPRWTEALILKM